MKCIDFDKKFQYCLTEWTKQHAKDYKTYDEMEDHVAQVYDTFLDTPADWLSGAKPGEYFEQFDNAKQLVDWMEDYEKQRVPVPDMLLNRISALGEAAEAPLMSLLLKERAPRAAKMSAVTLLREIGSSAPLDLYISLVSAWDGKDDLAESALESLESIGGAAAQKMRAALETATPEGQSGFLSLLCDKGQGDSYLVSHALRLLRERSDMRALMADVLGRLGDESVLPEIIRLAASEETPYLDFIELRSAIEKLGGEAPERIFDAEDPDYAAMRSIEEAQLKHDEEEHTH